MRIGLAGVTLSAVLATTPLAAAQEVPDCANSETEAATLACYGRLLGEAERALSREIIRVKALRPFLLDAELGARLDQSETAFLQYRKLVCDTVFAFRAKSSAQYSETLACQVLLDRQRRAMLENFYPAEALK